MKWLRPEVRDLPSVLAGVVCALSSVFFLCQWVYCLHRPDRYVQTLPQLAGSVAGLFLILSVALLCLEFGKKSIARVGGFLVLFVSFTDFAHENLNFGIDIDVLISSFFYPGHARHFYRMAPNTAVAFICSGLAVFLLSRKSRKEFSTFIANILGGFTTTFGLVSLFGYSTGVVSAYTWRNFVGMAMLTAMLFVVMGTAISWHALQRISLRQRRVHTPILVALTVVAIVLQLYRVQTELEIKSIQEYTSERATATLNEITLNLDEHLYSLLRMGKRWEALGGTPYSVWQSDVEEYSRHLKGYSRLIWEDRSGKVRWDYPAGNHADVPADLLAASDQKVAEFTVGVNPEDQSLAIRVPVKKNKQSDGSLLGFIELSRILNERYQFQNYSLAILWNDELVFNSESSSSDPQWSKTIRFDYHGVEMLLQIAPKSEQIRKYQSRLPMILLIFGILFAWALGYATYLFIVTRERAQQSQERLAWEQAISRGSDFIFVTIDKNGVVKSFNPAAEKFFEYTAAEVIDRATPMLWHDHAEAHAFARKLEQEFGRKFEASIDAFVYRARMGTVDRNEWTFITKSGVKKRGDLSIHVLKNRRGEVVGYVGIVRDVTDQRRAEEKLIQSSKMASLGEMAGGVAHEINNPLTIIQGRATRLMQLSERNEPVSQEVLHDSLKSIVETSRRIAKIVKGLATFSRNAELDALEPAELSRILDDTLELCRERFLKNDIQLEVAPYPNVVISCRPTQISQVFLNLLNNAFDAVRGLDSRWVKVEVSQKGEWVQIRVTDSGLGIAKDISDKMMEPFFTTKEVGQGTGLGLSISKGIVDGHGGKLSLDTASAHTSFLIELPLSDGEA